MAFFTKKSHENAYPTLVKKYPTGVKKYPSLIIKKPT
jgi:hypothetical protein